MRGGGVTKRRRIDRSGRRQTSLRSGFAHRSGERLEACGRGDLEVFQCLVRGNYEGVCESDWQQDEVAGACATTEPAVDDNPMRLHALGSGALAAAGLAGLAYWATGFVTFPDR